MRAEVTPKSITISNRKRLTPAERAAREESTRIHAEFERPRVRGDCVDRPRPCPWVGCQYHLYLDVTSHGSLKLNFPQKEVEEIGTSCALDIAEQEGGLTLERLCIHLNLTRERVRQIQDKVLDKIGGDLVEYSD